MRRSLAQTGTSSEAVWTVPPPTHNYGISVKSLSDSAATAHQVRWACLLTCWTRRMKRASREHSTRQPRLWSFYETTQDILFTLALKFTDC